MRPYKSIVLFLPIILFLGLIPFPNHSNAGKTWVSFGNGRNSSDTIYYYDPQSVQHFPDNHVSVWMKVNTPGGVQSLHTEISCAGSLFRVIQAPPTDFWDKIYNKGSNQTQYVVSGWLEISPDSEVNILRRLLCSGLKKNSD
jgi:hypothetical protein